MYVDRISSCALLLIIALVISCVNHDEPEPELCNINSPISYAAQIKPILDANCIKSGCHNGDNGAERNWIVFANVKAKAEAIKTRTGNRTMPADIAPTGLPQNEIDLIACWVDQGAQNN